MNILVVAGELSGDEYGAAVVEALREKKETKTTIYAIGGTALSKVADHFLMSITHLSNVGIFAPFQKWGKLRSFYKTLRKFVGAQSIDKVILIDFQFHNVKVAELFQKYHIPITTVVTPNFWLYKDKRNTQKLIAYSKDIVTIFKPEYEWYTQFTNKAHYFGHPLMTLLEKKETETPLQSEESNNSPIISFFPGSRQQELNLYLEEMVKAMPSLIDSGYILYIAVASERYESRIKKILKKYKVEAILYTNDKTELIKKSAGIICASGTTTLQAIILEKPLVIVAALSPVTYFAAKYILRLKMPYITLPNYLANEEIVPELVQSQISAHAISSSIKEQLSPTKTKTIRHRYQKAREALYSKHNVFDEVATLIIKKN